MMKTQSNRYCVPVETLFERIVNLRGILFAIKNQLDEYEGFLNGEINNQNRPISSIGVGIALVIRDFRNGPSEVGNLHHTGKFLLKKGEEYLKLKTEVLERESAFTVSQAYEAFETFLKDMIAALYFHNPELADEAKVKKFEDSQAGSAEKLDRYSIKYWYAYVRYLRPNGKKWNCEELLKHVRKFAKDLERFENNNKWNLNLQDWFTVVTEIRHAATHSNFVIKKDKMLGWCEKKRKILEECFSGECFESEYRLHLSTEQALRACELLAEYGYLIFNCISECQGEE